MLTYFLIGCLLVYTEGHPKYRRHRRDDDVGGITYAPCKDTYSQCPEWKKSGMCDMPQYKDYMPLVCTDTCGFCKGIQKARSEITAPTIIDATEHGLLGDNAENVLSDAKDHARSKIHTRSKSASKSVPKAEIKEANKEDASSGTAETDEEENSGMPSEEKSNFNESFDEDLEDEESKEDGKENKKFTAEKKNIVKELTEKNKAATKSKTAAVSMKNKITATKDKTTANKKSKVISTKNKIDEKKTEKEKKDKHVTKEKSEVSELMSEKGDTAAVRNKKAEKKSSTTVIKKPHKAEVDSVPSPKIKEEQQVAEKRTDTDKKPDGIEATIADLSGAGSGEIDTDILSGETPFRSRVESGDEAEDGSEEEEEEGEEDEDEDEEPAHQRQNFQLHGDPEMVDLKPKNASPQPDLNDFPDKEDEKSGYTAEEEGSDSEDSEPEQKNKDDEDEGELDDLKIEELLNPNESDKKKKKKTKKEKAKTSLKEGKISMVLQQNYNQHYDKKDTPSYQMLAGNIKKDIEKMVKGTSVKDIAFSEVSVEGNPRQSGKTKASFNVDASSNEWMKKLLKLVDGGDIDGLRVIKGSLEIEEE